VRDARGVGGGVGVGVGADDTVAVLSGECCVSGGLDGDAVWLDPNQPEIPTPTSRTAIAAPTAGRMYRAG